MLRIVDYLHTIVIPESQDGTILGRISVSSGARHLVTWTSGETTVIETDDRRRVIAESYVLSQDEAQAAGRGPSDLHELYCSEIEEDA